MLHLPNMDVLPVLLDPVSALDQFKGGPVLSGPVLVLEFPEDLGLDQTRL